jgi:glycyl-tRNA synthetase alpha chain
VQGVENVYDLNFNGGENDRVTYGDVFLQNEQEFSKYNFEAADTDMLFRHFADAEKECKSLLERGAPAGGPHTLAVPAYEQVIKASHNFNLLDARGVISVTERQSYILRIRELAKACGAAWLQTAGGGAA